MRLFRYCFGIYLLHLSLCITAMAQELTYSSYLGGSLDEGSFPYFAYIAVDDNGFGYMTGRTRSSDLPVTDDSSYALGYDVFVVKINPSSNGAADLTWATYLGGSDHEFARGVGVDSSGAVFVMGVTLSDDFPTTDGTSGPGIFVVQLVPDLSTQSVVYATVIGPATQSDTESFGTLVVDDFGNAYVISTTDSLEFPIVPTGRSEGGSFAGGARDAIVTKLDPFGAIVYSRFLGGIGDDAGRSITIDAAGDAFVTGQTSSADFPISTGAYQTLLNGSTDAFVVHLDSAGDIVWSSFLGGSADDMGRDGAIAVDASGRVYLTGRTQSDDFPVHNAFDSTKNKQNDAFMTVLDPSLGTTGNVYSTYLGGSSGERGQSINVDATGSVYVVGRTVSKDFPTTPDAWSTTSVGKHDVWLAKLDPSLAGQASLISSTYFGGSRDDGSARGVLYNNFEGNVQIYLSGDTWSTNFPTTLGAYAEVSAGSSDAFFSIMEYTQSPPQYTYTVGGSVSGLTGSGLVLINSGGDDEVIASNGAFTFDTPLADGSGYAVTVKTQPTNLSQTCALSNDSGTLAGADITNVTVTCVTDTFTVGGNVSGLAGAGLVLQNNAGDDLAIGADGSFTFVTPLNDGSSYAVTVKTQPTGPKQSCAVSNGGGTLAGADVTGIDVVCFDLPEIIFSNDFE